MVGTIPSSFNTITPPHRLIIELQNNNLTGVLEQSFIDHIESNNGTISFDPENAPE